MKNFLISLAVFMIGMLHTCQLSAQCDPNCSPAINLNISTGWDNNTSSLIGIGQIDPHWRLMNTPPLNGPIPVTAATPSPPTAYTINPINSTWNVFPGARALSMTNQANFGPDNANGLQPWRFRRYFCVCQDAEVILTGQFKADDTGSLTLYDSNGNPTPFSAVLPAAPNTNNFNVGINFADALFLTAGTYYLEVELINTNAVASGFAVQGNMMSANGPTLYEQQPNCCTVSVITGQKILDNNCNQQFDPLTDQPGIGFVFDLIDNSTGGIIRTVTSDNLGEFVFNNLPPGNYTVRERPQFGWLGLPSNIVVNLGSMDVQTVTFFNCPYTPSTLAGCVYGDITANPTNIHNEKGLAIVNNGGFFGTDNTHLFSTTNLPYNVVGDEHIIGKRWNNATGTLHPFATFNDFIDADPGAHGVENLHVVNTNIPCNGGAFAAVGTTRNGTNRDVFYAEYSTNGTMLHYEDVTSTPNPDRESVHELIKLNNNELMWVGTQRAASSFPSFNELMISNLPNCSSGISHHVFSFQDNNGQQINVTGHSILELDTPLFGQPTAKYAVTGSAGDNTYLLLLNASFNATLNFAYDIDGNPSTKEESIRIRRSGNNLFLLGNSQEIDNFGITVDEKIFMLKLGFVNQIGIPNILTNKLYDIPGGGERVVDAEINFAGDIILTGVSALHEGLIVSSDPLNQKTFLMGLDPFGNQLWLNQVLLQEGSEPADLQFRPLFDEINIVGSCWTNETTTLGGGAIVNTRKFDEMFIRATYSGELALNSGCTNPLDASVTEPTPIISSFMTNPVTPPFNSVNGGFNYDDYFMEIDSCSSILECDSVMITPQSILDPNGLCCYSLDYYNNSPGPVYELCLRFPGTLAATFSNVSTDPNFIYTLNGTNTDLKIRSASSAALPPGTIPGAIDFCIAGASNVTIVYLWKDINGNVVCEQADEITCDVCEADFTWTADCCTVQLDGIATGTGPFIYEWDINCDNPAAPELTGQSVNWTFNGSGTYNVCLKITDTATGCMANVQKQVTVVDNSPTLTCPPSITISTDPGLCIATHQLIDPTADDDCTTMFFPNCTMSGATAGPAISPVPLNKGITTIDCAIEDNKGQLATCSYTITVVDNENPIITCTPPQPVSVPACAGGANVTFANPVVTDNCPMVTWTSSHQSGDFFPCGTTMVTFTATDMAGNQSTCAIPVVVNCLCAEVSNELIECTDVDDQFFFSVNVTDLTGPGTSSCTITVSSPQSGITISNPVTIGTGPTYLISGLIDVAAPPMPNVISIVVHVNCVCPDGTPHSCSFPINLPTPCCKEISIDPQEVCKVGGAVQIPLIGCNTLYDVQQVRWYVSDTPCPAIGSFGPPIQVTNGCAPLTLSPQYHNGDVCVYAEVVMGPDAGPCSMLTSNIATITLCETLSCNLNNQAFCWTGTAITPAPLTVTLVSGTPNCTNIIEWFDPNGNLIPSATGMTTYQPPALSFTAAATDCSQSYTYEVQVTNVCGTQSCTATIRLDNEAAPNGLLELLPPDVNPLCYGEDAEIKYTPECVGDPERWDWFRRPDTGVYSPLATNGDRNPLYFTNRLYEDTWIKVEKTNGVCPTDEIELFLDIIGPLTINTFTAKYGPVCTPTFVNLTVDFDPSPAPIGCSYTIYWYQNGDLLGNSSHTNSPASYAYTPPAGTDLHGNYYCVIESTCCPGQVKSPVERIDPPMEVYVAGPCFRCNCDTIKVQGIVLNPIAGFNCTYQWYDNGILIPGETGDELCVTQPWAGPFTFEVTCTDGTTTCVDSADYSFVQCGVWVNVTEEFEKLDVAVYPNPTSGHILLELGEPVEFNRIEVFDLQGKLVHIQPENLPGQVFKLDLNHLPNGVYVIQAISAESEILIERVIKQ